MSHSDTLSLFTAALMVRRYRLTLEGHATGLIKPVSKPAPNLDLIFAYGHFTRRAKGEI